MANLSKKENQNVYILHTYPFKETSLIVDILSKDFGRISVVAKGARRPRSSLRGLLLPFQGLQATWSGLQELKTLHSIEWSEAFLNIEGDSLICGFYLNELVMRMVPKDDPYPELFNYYHKTITSLTSKKYLNISLRCFELKLLQELGYKVSLNIDNQGVKIDPVKKYFYQADLGASLQRVNSSEIIVSGKTLIDMEANCYDDKVTEKESKQLMRYLINYYVGDKPLHSKKLFMSNGDKIN